MKDPPATNIKGLSGDAAGILGRQIKSHGGHFIGFQYPIEIPGVNNMYFLRTALNSILRAQVAIILFTAAYIAEVVRGGLQAMDRGQYEAAESLGLNYFQTMRMIILPQALKIVIPPTVGILISAFKDTSLVAIIGLSVVVFLAYNVKVWGLPLVLVAIAIAAYTIITVMVSPMARPMPNITPVSTPERAAGKVTRQMVCHSVAPRAKAASR